MGEDLAGITTSRAGFPTNPGPNRASFVDADLFGGELVNVGTVPVPLDQFIDFGQMSVLLSESTATDALNGEAISGLGGADGAITLDSDSGEFGAATIDLLSLFNAAGVAGVTDLAINQADLILGVGGAHVEAIDGVFQDPDGVGGLGQYRVAEASLLLQSQMISQASDMMYTAIGDFESQIRDAINTIMAPVAVAGATVTVNTDIQQQVFNELLKQPICSSVTVVNGENVCDTDNTILSIDFATGQAVLHLDRIMDGERPDAPDAPTGINNQLPNTELIDSTIYPMIAESIHDVMNAAVDIAAGAVENALNAVTIDVDFAMGGATKSATMGLNGTFTETPCVGNALACTALNTAFVPVRAALTTAGGLLSELLNNGAQEIFDLAIGTVKTDMITVPLRNLIEPFLQIIAGVISVQINHQVQESCVIDGVETIGSLEVSALSVGLLSDTGTDGAARIGLGNAGVRIGACAALALPVLEVETPVVPGDCAMITSSGWTPNSEVTLQLTDAAGNPVGEPLVVTADADGNLPVDTCLTIPDGTAPGDYTVVGTDPDGNTVSAPVTVYDPELAAQTPVLPGDCATITSSGWIPGSQVSLQLTDAAGNPVGTPVVVTADAAGNLPADTCVTIPEGTAPGDYTVVGTDPNGNTAEGPVVVAAPGTPVLDAGSPVPAGDDVPVTSGGWDPNTEVTLQLTDPAGDPVGEPVVVTTDSNGDIPAGTVLPVPADAEPGEYTVVGTDPDGTEATDVVTVYAPTLTVPAQTAPDTCLPATSGGWIPGSVVTLQLTDAAGNPVGEPVTAIADAEGNLPADTCVPIPAGTPNGDYTVVATDPTGAEVTAPVTVDDAALTPTLEAGSPVPAGGSTPLTSGGWAPGSQVTFQLTDPSGAPVGDPLVVTVDGNGDLLAGTVLPIPAGSEPGDYTVTGTDADGNTAQAPVTVYAPALEAGSPVPAGGTTPLTSDGWLPNSEVTFQLTDPTGAPVGDPLVVTTDANGVIPAGTVLPIPADATAGDYTVVGTDPNGAEVSAPVEVYAPTLQAVSPVEPGSTAEVTSGGWLPNSPVTLQLTDADGNPVGDPIQVTTDANGDVPAGTTLTIPDTAVEGDVFTVVGTDENGATAQAPVEVMAEIPVLDPTLTAGSPILAGGTSPLTSTGWLPNSQVSFQLYDAAMNPVGTPVVVTTDGTGAIPAGTTIPVGDVAGDFTVVGTDTLGNDAAAPVVVYAPAISATSPVEPGAPTDVTSTGWLPNSEVTLVLTDPAGAPVGDPIVVTTDGTGSIPAGTTFTIPATAVEGDTFTVTGTDANGATVSAPVEVLPAAVTPDLTVQSPVAPEQCATVTSGGWVPGSTVTLQLTDASGAPVGEPVVVTADAEGNLPADTCVEIPAGTPAGDYTVVGSDPDGNEVSAPVAIYAPAISATSPVEPGAPTDVTSTGWLPNSEVTLVLTDPAGAPVGDPIVVTTDGTGSIPAGTTFTIPATAVEGDTFTMTGTDANGATVSAPVEVVPVTAPVLNPTLTAGSPILAGGTSPLTSTGWLPNSQVTFQLRDAAMNPVGEPVVVTTDADGAIPAGTTIPVGDTAGDFTVVGTDELGNDAAAPVVVYDPAISATSPVTPGSATEVTSGGWLPSSQVTLQLTDADGNPVGTPVTVTTDANGDVPAGTVLAIPADAVAGTTFTVVATDANGATVSAPVEVVAGAATPWVGSPTPAPAGGELPITSGGWAPNTEVSLQLVDPEGNPVGAPVVVTTDGDGNVPAGTVIPVPADALAGDYTVVADGPDGATAEAPATVYAPVISATSPVAAGAQTSVETSGWLPNSEVTLQLVDAAGAPVGAPITVTVDANGELAAPAGFTIPADATEGDTFSVIGTDANGAEVTAPVLVTTDVVPGTPTIEASSPVAAGDEIAVTSGGWAPDTEVTLVLTDAAGQPVGDPIVVTTDGDGDIPATAIPVPADAAPGDYTVTATDDEGTTVSAPVEVYAPGMSIEDEVYPGECLPVSSTGWIPGSEITIQLRDAAGDVIAEMTVVADQNGNLPAVTCIEVPEDAEPGDHTVVVSDGDTEVSAPVTVVEPVAGVAHIVANSPVAAGAYATLSASSGFAPGESVELTMVDGDGNVVAGPVTVTAGADGSLPASSMIPVPGDLEAGAFHMLAAGATGTEADSWVSVYNPTVTATSPVPVGGATGVTSTGWLPNSMVTIQLVDPTGAPYGEPVMVHTTGAGTLPRGQVMQIAAAAALGGYDVVITDENGTERAAPFEVVAGAAVGEPTITVSDPTPSAGDQITVTGSGYTPGTVASVQLFDADGNPLLAEPVQVTVLDDGTFTADVVLPADTADGHYTVVGDGSDGLTAQTAIDVAATAGDTADASGDATADASGDATADAEADGSTDASGDATADAQADGSADGNDSSVGNGSSTGNGTASGNGSGSGSNRPPLAATGTDLMSVLPFGLLLLVAGAVLVTARRKKESAQADD